MRPLVCSAQQAVWFEQRGEGGIQKGVCLPPLVCSGRSMIDATPKGSFFFKMTCLSSDCLDVGVYRNHLHALRVLAR